MNSPPSRSTSPSIFMLDGGQVFCSGVADIGLGTQGVGPQTANYDRRRDDAQLRAYFQERDAKVREQEAKDAVRLAKIAREQDLSPRKRLQKVMEAREEEIARMTRERKAFEVAFKEQSAKEAALKNERIHKEKEIIQEQLLEAKRQRELQKERELKAIRAERAELLKLQKIEEEIHRRILAEHHSQLRHWHEISKARAAEEAKKRLEAKEVAVRDQRKALEAKKQSTSHVIEEIVTLKSALIHSVKDEIKAGRVVFEKRENELTENAKKIKQESKKIEQEKAMAIRAYREEVARRAAAAKEEAARHQDEYLRAKNDQKRLLNEQAKLQKERALAMIAEEREAVHREKQERFEWNKAAILRSKSATPTVK